MSKKTAIDAPRGTFFWLDPDDPRLKVIGLDTDDGPDHPLYDDRIKRPLDPNRVKNFAFYGCRKPISVRVVGDEYHVVDGRGRVRYSREVKSLQTASGETETIRIPAIVAKGDDADLFGVSRALNLHDTDGPLTNAKNAQRMLAMGRTIAEVAVSFGVSEQTIRNWETLLNNVAPEVLSQVIAGEITGTAAIQLAPIPKQEQAAALEEIKSEVKETGGKVTVERAAKKAREKTGKAAGLTPKARLEEIGALIFDMTAESNPTKETLLKVLDKIAKLSTGKSLKKLADMGD